MSGDTLETVVVACMPGLPEKFTYLDCLPRGTGESTIDFVGPKEFLRVQFVSEQGRRYAQEQALVRLSPPSRFLELTFSKEQRRAVVMEGQEKDCTVEYVTLHLEKENLVFQNHDVPLYVWLPPVQEVAELAVGMESDSGENLGEFGLGYLLSAFKDYLTKAGWMDEETFSIKKREEDARGQFLNKYHWFEHCDIPEHLFAVQGVAEFESGVAVGVSCVKVQANLMLHRRLVKQLEGGEVQRENRSSLAAPPESLDAELALLKDLVKAREEKGTSEEGPAEFAAKLSRTEIASLGGAAKKRDAEMRNLASEAAEGLPTEMRQEFRRCLKKLPDDLFCFSLLATMFPEEKTNAMREARKACKKWVADKKVSKENVRLWCKKLRGIPAVAEFIHRVDQQEILDHQQAMGEEIGSSASIKDDGLHTE